LKELVQANEQLAGQPILNIGVDCNVLLATVGGSDYPKPIAVNLQSGEIVGLNSTLVLNDEQWHITERFFTWVAPKVPGESITDRTHVYDIYTGEEFVMEGDGGAQSWPVVSGDMVVWSEIHGDRSWDIYVYNIASGKSAAAVARPGGQIVPKVEGEWIVYMQRISSDMRDVIRDVYLHHLPTGEDMLLGPSPFAGELEGDTYGIANGRVLWVGWSAGEEPDLLGGSHPALHLYDLQSRTESIIDTSSICVPIDFQMAGALILFGCEDGFHGYDLAQRIFFDVPYPEHSIGYVYLSETHVVFRIQEKHPTVWDYLTPGASPMPPREYWLTPQPARFRLFVAPITR